ncbi:MAG TPA: hemerythrin domain-containing protein [Phycisphaerae bacterium]|jgi:hemerythrin-like domain-containing protein
MSTCNCGTKTCKRTASEVLKEEHRVIERVLDAMGRMLAHAWVDEQFLIKALDFLRNFADGCHHAKEEGELFPILESAGVPRQGGPIGCLTSEHEEGRRLLATIEANLDGAERHVPGAVVAVRRAVAEYIALLRQHIEKEDSVLFVMADHLLGAHEQDLMLKAFDRAEHENGNVGKHERYLALAEELANWEFDLVSEST